MIARRLAGLRAGARAGLAGGAALAVVLAAVAVAAGAPLLPSLTAALGAAWLAGLLAAGRAHAPREALAVPALLLSGAALASVLVAREPSVFAVSLALAPAAAALAASAADDAGARRALLAALTAALALLGAWSLWLLLSGADSDVGVIIGDRELRRIYPESFGHPNQFAAALALLLPIPLAQAVAGRGRLWRLASGAAAALGAAALLLTYSRAFWLAFAAAAVIVAATRRARVVGLVLAAIGAAFAGPRIVARLTAEDTLDNVRLEIWGRALEVIGRHPLLGVGVENFGSHAGDLTLPQSAEPPPHAHNLLLTTASEVGLVGAAALAAVLVALIVPVVRRLREGGGPDRALLLGVAGASVAAVVGGTGDSLVFHHAPTLYLAAVLAGLAAAAGRPASDLRTPPPRGGP